MRHAVPFVIRCLVQSSMKRHCESACHACFALADLQHKNRILCLAITASKGNCGCPAGVGDITPDIQQSSIPLPAYQTGEGPFCLDLSCLLDDSCKHSEEATAAIKAVNVQARQWPSAALERLTTLDQSQLLALKVAPLASSHSYACVMSLSVCHGKAHAVLCPS